jgi:hypothetical protein
MDDPPTRVQPPSAAVAEGTPAERPRRTEQLQPRGARQHVGGGELLEDCRAYLGRAFVAVAIALGMRRASEPWAGPVPPRVTRRGTLCPRPRRRSGALLDDRATGTSSST